jgi:hypothetical protein
MPIYAALVRPVLASQKIGTHEETTAVQAQRLNWWPIIWFWAVVAAVLAFRALVQADTTTLLGDTDDAMRMVTATDLLRGQPWQDLIQHRDNAPYGGQMHWSRLVDAPIALLMLAAMPLFGAAAAADVAAIVWPLLLLLGLLVLSVLITRRLVPEGGVVAPLVLPVINLVLAIEFAPGRVDHHNVQILLIGGLLLSLLVGRTRRTGGAWAGVLAATSIAVGIETLPLIATAVAAIAFCWAADPSGHKAALGALGASLALALLGHFLLATPPAAYFVPVCDTLSIVHVIAGAAGGAALLALALGPTPTHAWQRLVLLSGLGSLVFVGMAVWAPDCVGGTLGVNRRLAEEYFVGIDELQSLWDRFGQHPASAIAFASPVVAALAISAWRAYRERGDRRVDWLILLGFVIVAALFMLLQVRGARLAALLALPAGCWLIAAARQRYSNRRTAGSVALLAGAWLLGCTLLQLLIVGFTSAALPSGTSTAGRNGGPVGNCHLSADYAPLAALAPGNVAAPPGISSHILRYTEHSVLSAGYHRNAKSILDSNTFFSGSEEEAKAIAVGRRLDYVVLCPGSNRNGAPRDAGWPWRWTTPLSGPEDRLQVYRIMRGPL